MAPTSVFLSSGSPTRSVSMRACSSFGELLGDRLLHEQPGARAADVALVEEDPVDDALDGLVERRVVVDDVGGLAAQLQGEPPAGAGEAALDLLADVGGAGERDLVDGRRAPTTAAPTSPAPGSTLSTPGGQPGLGGDLGEHQRGERGGLGGLEHDRVAAGERRRDLPRGHEQREVPRDHRADHAERLRCRAEARVLQLVGPARVVEQVRRRGRDVDVAGLADRLAVVERLQHGQLAGALGHDPRDPEQVLGALGARHRAPHLARRRGARRPPPGRRRRTTPCRPRPAPPRWPG